MVIRWTGAAADDLEQIADYLFEHAPEQAARMVQSIYNAPSALLKFPALGRIGKEQGTRELVLTSLPYILVYVLSGDAIHIARILHGAQRWP